MITCPNCASTAFDDMTLCYGCLQPLKESADLLLAAFDSEMDLEEDLCVEEPVTATFAWPYPVVGVGEVTQSNIDVSNCGSSSLEDRKRLLVARGAQESAPARFHVVFEELFAYDAYLEKTEGRELTVGCARDNNIVLPHTTSKRHQLRIYFFQGQLWVEDRGSTEKARIEGMPLTGTRCLERGATIEVGSVRIECMD